MNIEILTRLGLTATESLVYTTLLEAGTATITELARRTQLHRPAVYQALPKLLDKQLIAKVVAKKRTLLVPESPDNLLFLAQDLERDIQNQLPSLKTLFERSSERPILQVFEGARGIKKVFYDLLGSVKKGDVVYRYESPIDYHKNKKYIPPEYGKRLVKTSDVDWYIITNEKTYGRKTRYLGRAFKKVPESFDLFNYDVSQFIYNNKVAFIDFKNESAAIIESQSIAMFQKKIFKLLFNKL
jgi:DNA-binding transcriptional regulator GbsR (MarR family)